MLRPDITDEDLILQRQQQGKRYRIRKKGDAHYRASNVCRGILRHVSEGIVDPSIINALSNLRPLNATANQKKGSSYFDGKP